MKTRRILSVARLSFPLATALAALFNLATPSASAVTYYWDSDGSTAGFGSTTGAWGTDAFWTTVAGGGATHTAVTATLAADVVNFGTATVNYGNATVGIAAGGVTSTSIVFGAGQTTAITLGTLGGGAITLGGSTRTITSSGTGHIINAPIILTGATTISQGRLTNNTGTLTLNGGLSGTGGVTFNASGDSNNNLQTIILGGASTYTGNTTIGVGNDGNTFTVRSTVLNALPTSTVLTLTANGGGGTGRTTTFDLFGNNQTIAGLAGAAPAALRSIRVTSTAAATLTINGTTNNSFGGTNADSPTPRTTIIAGAVSLVKSGSGTQTLAGPNTYTGQTTVNGGTLTVSNATALGTPAGNTVVASGGRVFVGTNSLSVAEPFNIAGTGIGGANGAINIGGNVTGVSFTGGITLSADATIQGDGGTSSTFSGGINAGADVLTFKGSGAITVSTTGISGVNGSVVKNTGGTLTLSAANSYTGGTSVDAGTLTLNYVAQDNSKLSDTAALVLGDGILNLDGGTHTEIVGSTTLTAGTASRVTRSSGTSVLQMGAITRNAGATIIFDAPGIASTDTLNTNGILGPWATIGGTDWAVNSTDGAAGLITASTYTDVARQTAGTIADGLATNIRIVEGVGANDITLGAATTTINTLNQSASGGASAAMIDPAGQTLRTNGILVGTGAGGLTIGNGVNNGILTTATAGGDLSLINNTASGLTINSAIADNTSASTLTKSGSGSGPLALNGANTYAGGTILETGTLVLGNAGALGTGPLTINGGSLDSSVVNLVNANNNVQAWNADFTFNGTQNLNLGTGTVTLGANRTVTVTANTLTVGGAIDGGAFNLTKAGTGTLTLSGANTYTGNTTVNGGTLNITGSIAGNTTASTLAYGGTAGNTVVNLSGTVTAFKMTGANVAGAVSVFNQTAGSLTMIPTNGADVQWVAQNGGYGALNITGGTFNTGRFDVIGITGTGTGVVYVGNTGVFNNNVGDWLILPRTNGTGEITVGPGGSLVRGPAVTAQLAITMGGTNSRGVLNIAGGDVDSGLRAIQFGFGSPGAGNQGFVNLAGGTLSVGLAVNETGTTGSTAAYFNFAGGTLKMNAALSAWIPATSITGHTTTSTIFGPITNNNNANAAFNTAIGTTSNFTGGLTVDTNNFPTTFTNAFLAASGYGVTQANIGDVSLLAGNSGYIGAPSVSFSNPAAAGADPASGYAVISGGVVTGIVITNPGVYALNETPSITLTGGGGGIIAPFPTSALATPNTSGGLAKIGANTLTLTAANTYTGATLVSEGQLTVSGTGTLAGTSGLSVIGGATFNYLPTTIATALTLGAGSTLNLASGSTLGLAWDAATASQIAVSGAATVGTGTGVAVNMVGAGYTSGIAYTILTAASGLDVGNYTFLNLTDYTATVAKLPTSVSITPTTVAGLGAAFWKGTSTAGLTKIWAASDGSTESNWSSSAGGAVQPLIPGSAADVTISATAPTVAPTATTLGANMTVKTLTISDTTNGLGLDADGNTLTITPTAATGGLVLSAGVPASTIAAKVALGADQTWTNDSASTLTVSGVVSGAFGLTKAGSGLVNITGATAVTSTTVEAGTLYMGAQTGASTTTTLGAGNPVTLNGSSNLTVRRTNTGGSDVAGAIGGTGSLTLIGDNLSTSASGDFAMNNASTYSGGTSITGARAIVTSSGAALGTGLVTTGANGQVFVSTSGLTLTNDFSIGGLGWNEPSGFLGALRLNGGTLSGNIALTSNARITGANTSTMSGIISGGFGMDFFEDTVIGTIILSGANTYTGTTSVNSMGSGTTFPNLIVSNNSALGTTAGGTIVYGTGTTGTGTQLTLADGITVTDETLTLDPTANGYRATMQTSGTATWDGNLVAAGTGGFLQLYSNTGGNLTIGSSDADTITGTNLLAIRGVAVGTINSTISNGIGGIFKTEAGTWTITSNNNDFTGTPSIANGILSVGSIANSGINSALGAGTVISLGQNSAAAGTLQFTGVSGGSSDRALTLANGATGGAGRIENTVAGQTLTLSGALTVATPASACSLTLTGAGNGLLSGGIAGSPLMTLSKTGLGTWTLSGANTYTGTTTIDEGTLAFTTTNPSLAGGLTFGASAGSTTTGALDLSAASATFAGAALVRSNFATANTISIGSGRTLTLNGGLTLGYDAAGGTGQTDSKLTATGLGSLAVNATTINISVNQAATNAAYWSKGTLDVSGLAAFSTDVTTFNIGVGSTTHGPGDVLLSNTANTILAITLQVGVTGANNGRGTSTLTLGTGTNVIQADNINIGRNKSSGPGVVTFVSQTASSPGTVTIADKAGTGRANIDIANQVATATVGGAIGTLDLRGHIATVSAGTVTIGSTAANSNSGSTSGTLSFDAGTFDVNTLNLAPKSANGTGTATANVNVGGGAFTVNTAFTLGSQAGGGASVATLNLTGGTFTSNADIVDGGGSSTSTVLLSGGTLDMAGNDIGTLANPIILTAESGTLSNVASINGTGGLTKTTAGTLVVNGANPYVGDTTVSQGTLTLSSAAGPSNANTGNDASTVTIAAAGATLNLTYAGTDIVDKLFIGATQIAAGVYGPSATPLAGITGTGTLTVTTGPVGGYSSWQAANGTVQAIDFDHDNDGVSNGIEYFLGGNTNTTGFTALPDVTNTAGILSVTWTKGATYTGTYGADFSVETSATLTGVWATEPSPGTVTITGNDVTYTFPPGAINFARLKVTGP